MSRRLIAVIITIVLGWQVLLLATAAGTVAFTRQVTIAVAVRQITPTRTGNIWEYWDAGIYLRIAQHGYTYIGAGVDYGFWPLWPLVIRGVSVLVGQPVIAGIIATHVMTLVSCCLLYALVRIDEPNEVAKRAVLWVVVWPMAFMLTALYSEALFFLFVLVAMYAARRRQWLVAGFAAALLALTRHIGAFIIVPLFVEWWSQRTTIARQWYQSSAWLGLFVIGATAFPLTVFTHRGSFLAPFNYQRIGLYHAFSNPFTEAWRYVMAASHDPRVAAQTALWFVGLLLVALAIREAIRGRLRASDATYAALFFLFPMFSTNNLIGIPRYTIVLFPIYIVLATRIRRRSITNTLMIVSLLAQLILFICWVQTKMVTL